MKNSIKTQIVILFAGLTVGSLVALMAMNSYLLQPFYVRQKVKAFENMYDTLLEEMSDYGQSLEEIGLGIQDEAENENISFLISNQRFGKVVSNVHNMDYLNQQMINYILNDAQRHGEILKETENYLIVKTKDPLNENEYIEQNTKRDYQDLQRLCSNRVEH